MDKGIILHLENDNTLLGQYSSLYQQMRLELDYIGCATSEEFNAKLADYEFNIKAIIFDLIGSKATKEELAGAPEFLTVIDEKFVKYNLPIFIYSGHLESIGDKYDSNGTVFKISKEESIENVFTKIKFLLDSGFIDVFCPGGILEREIKEELNKSFTFQFSQNTQIEEVLSSIVNSGEPENQKERVKNVLKRIAIKSLSADLLAPIADSADKVHPIEHFYKRQSKLPIWTGDIWTNKKTGDMVLVLTPRCDLATNKVDNIMVCSVEPPPQFPLDAKPDKLLRMLSNHLVDNIEGKAKRYIPKNVFFPTGGMANLAKYNTIELTQFVSEYQYTITLSDDLTNEIIGKFAYYFLRTGITNINEQEFEAIIKAVKPDSDNDKK